MIGKDGENATVTKHGFESRRGPPDATPRFSIPRLPVMQLMNLRLIERPLRVAPKHRSPTDLRVRPRAVTFQHAPRLFGPFSRVAVASRRLTPRLGAPEGSERARRFAWSRRLAVRASAEDRV